MKEAAIIRAVARQTLNRKCILLVPHCNWTGHECDVLGVTTDGRLIDIEVKVSRSDFRADASKDKWWHHVGYRYLEPDAHGYRRPEPVRERRNWPTRVWKHYYVMPADIWRDDMLEQRGSDKAGVLLARPGGHGDADVVINCRQRAVPNREAKPVSPQAMLDIARLANLRMWDALL